MSSNEYEREDTNEYDRNTTGEGRDRRGKWVSALIALAGAWMLLEAMWFDLLAANFWNDVIVGLLLIALGGYNYYRRDKGQMASTAAAAVAALLGLWLIISPFMYGDAGGAQAASDSGFWNDIIIGLVVLALGAYSTYETRNADMATSPTKT